MEKLKRRRKHGFPYRYVIMLILWVGAGVSFSARNTFKYTTKHMIQKKYKPPNKTLCNVSKHYSNETFIQVKEKFFSWTKQDEAMYHTAYIWSYIAVHLPVGIITVKYGAKTLLTVATLLFTGITIVTPPMLLYVTGSPVYAGFYRAITGATTGCVFPCMHSIIGNWIPADERNSASSFVFSANPLAIGINLLAANQVILWTNHWSHLYYICGVFSFLWVLLWHTFGANSYQDSTRVKKKEKQSLDIRMEDVTFQRKSIPWLRMLKSVPLWALIIAEWGHHLAFRLISQEIYKFLRDAYGISDSRSARIVSVPFMLMALFTIIFGSLADFLVNNDFVHPTTLRKIYTTLGGIGPCLFFVTAYYAGCNKKTGMFILGFGIVIMCFYYAGTRINTLDIAPNFSGMIMAIANGIGSSTGLLNAKLLANFDVTGWRDMFWTCLCLVGLTNILFAVFGTTETQSWNEVKAVDQEVESIELEDTEQVEVNRLVVRNTMRSRMLDLEQGPPTFQVKRLRH